MSKLTRWRRHAAALSVVALVLAACGNGEDADEPDAPDDDEEVVDDEPDDDVDEDDADEPDDAEEDAAPEEIETGLGITEEPCPEEVNPDNGCIYLGILSDLSEGPFAPLGVEIVAGQEDFWERVNQDGGIAGQFDVNVTEYTRDTLYDPQTHSSEYRSIEPDILALAQTLGTPPTEAILPDMDIDNVVGHPAGWWSGQQFSDQDQGLILDSGYSYCMEAQVGLDYVADEVADFDSVFVVGFPGDYGGDFNAGAEAWAEATGAEHLGFAETGTNALVGNQDAAVGAVLESGADVVGLAVGPAEAAEIVGGAVAEGFEGQFIGSVPTWNPGIMDSPAAPALEAAFLHIGPWEPFDGGSDAHAAMQDAMGGEMPANDGYTFGWIWSYPLLSVLENAAANGDLTREGVRAAAGETVVDYEGALPDRDYSLDGGEGAPRVAVVSRPNSEVDTQLEVLARDVTGETAEAFDYSEPCIVP